MKLSKFVFLLLFITQFISAQEEVVHSVYFEFDKFNLEEKQANDVVAFVKAIDTTRVESIQIYGYCDDRGKDAYNYKLSNNRANTIKNKLIEKGINKFILLGENVLNAFPDEEDYYAEWADDCGDGWITLVNFQKHVLDEMGQYGMTNYLNWGGDLNLLLWQGKTPDVLFQAISRLMAKRLG